jgi:hypothetical protein
MQSNIKYIVSIIILFGIITACGDKKGADKDKQTTQKEYKDTVKINKDQYRVAEMFSDNKNQIIDLIQGPASFDIVYQGDSHFKATIMYPDGRLVAVLADVDGNFKGKKKIDVPETTAYILDVECKGQWSVYRE